MKRVLHVQPGIDGHESQWLDALRRPTRRRILQAGVMGLVLPSVVSSHASDRIQQSTASSTACDLKSALKVTGSSLLEEAEDRAVTGSGLRVTGTVRDVDTCEPIPGVKIIRWHTNMAGLYEDAYRASVTTDKHGAYSFETIVPEMYGGIDRHIHFRLYCAGYRGGITQYDWPDSVYPEGDYVIDFALKRA